MITVWKTGRKTGAMILTAMMLVGVLALVPAYGSGDSVALQGRVLDGATGAGVGGAVVTLIYGGSAYGDMYAMNVDGGEQLVLVADEGGRFNTTLQEGIYHFHATAEGYEPQWGMYETGNRLGIRLRPLPEPDATLTGIVLDGSTNQGIYNATVYLQGMGFYNHGYEYDTRYDVESPESSTPTSSDCDSDSSSGCSVEPVPMPYHGGYDPWVPGFRMTTTDASGRYHFGLLSGVYTLTIISPSHYGFRRQIVVGEGQNISLRTPLDPLPPINSTISGFVRNMDGEPLEGARVHIMEMLASHGSIHGSMLYPPLRKTEITGPDGYYTSDVRRGAYSIIVWIPEYFSFHTTVNAPANTSVALDAALDAVVLPPTNARIYGVVRGTDGAYISGANLSLERIGDGVAMGGMMGVGPMQPAMGLPYMNAAYDGQGMAINHLYTHIEYELYDFYEYLWGLYDTLWRSGYHTIESSANGSYSISCSEGLYVLNVRAIGYIPHRMVVDPRADRPMEVNITLRAYPPANSVVQGVVTDRTTSTPLPSATIYVYAYADTMYDDHDMSGAEPPRLGMGGQHTTAVVYSEDGTGYMENSYSSGWTEYGTFFAEATTNARGEYTISVPAGTLVMEVWAEGYSQVLTRFRIGPNDETTKHIHLQPGGSHEGRVSTGLLPLVDININDSPTFGTETGQKARTALRIGQDLRAMVDLGEHFYDPNGDSLSYTVHAPPGFVAYIDEEGIMHVEAPPGYKGGEVVNVYGSDGQTTIMGSFEVNIISEAETSATVVFLLGGIAAVVVVTALMSKGRMGKRGKTDAAEDSGEKDAAEDSGEKDAAEDSVENSDSTVSDHGTMTESRVGEEISHP